MAPDGHEACRARIGDRPWSRQEFVAIDQGCENVAPPAGPGHAGEGPDSLTKGTMPITTGRTRPRQIVV